MIYVCGDRHDVDQEFWDLNRGRLGVVFITTQIFELWLCLLSHNEMHLPKLQFIVMSKYKVLMKDYFSWVLHIIDFYLPYLCAWKIRAVGYLVHDILFFTGFVIIALRMFLIYWCSLLVEEMAMIIKRLKDGPLRESLAMDLWIATKYWTLFSTLFVSSCLCILTWIFKHGRYLFLSTKMFIGVWQSSIRRTSHFSI